MSRAAFVLVLVVAACGAALPPARNGSFVLLKAPHVEPIPGAPSPPQPAIVNGQPAASGQFPYQAAVYLSGRGVCGGSLISERAVLTAAHCVALSSEFVVYLGTIDWKNVESGSLIITTRSSIMHKKYNSRTLNNDIGLVGLGNGIAFTDNIKPIALASGIFRYTGFTGRLSGWGLTRDGGLQPDRLRYADLVVLSNAECRMTYGFKVVVSSTLCARKKLRSACSGDSGGPIVSKGKQIGVVSFSTASCQMGYPTGFARVSSFYKWIKSQQKNLS